MHVNLFCRRRQLALIARNCCIFGLHHSSVATSVLGPHLTAAKVMCACGLQLFVCVGILIAFAIGLPYDGKEAFLNLAQHQIAWWRVMFAIGLAPAALQVRCRKHILQD